MRLVRCISLLVVLTLVAAAQSAAAPPNVVVILADDLGFSDLGCYGGEIDTPHLDRLAAGGLRFTQGYNTARCWPTRAALLTGYYAQAVRRDALPGGPGGNGGTRPPWARLLPDLLAPAGYVSYHSGKWHVDGDPREQGFARSLDVNDAGQSNYFDAGGVSEDGTSAVASDGFYTTTAIGDHAVKCLREHATTRAGTPFFHYVPFTAPHFPLQAPPDLVAKYRDRYRAGWDAVRQARCERLHRMGIVTSPAADTEPDVGPPYQPKPQTLARLGAGEVDRPLAWATLTAEQQEFQATKMAIHAAMVEAMDRQVGRIVAQLDWKLVAAKNTPWELYDLGTDRCETKNLASTEPGRVQALEAEWNRIAEACRTLAADEPAVPAKASTKRPNIIYVMTDDQGYGDIAAHGNPIIQTPNLDRMHAESVRLTEFHASPTCSPTRAALMTGRHEFRSGVTHTIFERERLALSATTLPQILKASGYTTGIFGKWHLGDEDAYQPGKRGFDRVFIHGGGGIGQSYPGSCGDAPGNTYFDPAIRSDETFVKTKGYCTDVFFGAALEWIDRQRKHDAPFFCSLTPNAPHDPLVCPPGSDTPYLAKLEAAGITDQKERERIAKFYGMIENIDTNMGRLFAKLDEWGLAEDTLVVFTTDNGTATGQAVFNDGMRAQKGSPYRGGTRAPSFWQWKGSLPAGMDMPSLVAHIDVLPTLCDIADVEIPQAVAAKVEGRSFAPLLRGARIAWPDRPLVTHVGRWDRGKAAESAYRNCRIREGRWSLVNVKNRPDGWELYDVAADPGEKVDVATSHPETVKRLATTYDAWWASVQPDLVNEDLDGPSENPFKVAFDRQFGPAPTLPDVSYGPHPKQRFHFWKSPQATAEKPVPLVFFIHGGGWQGGDRLSGLTGMLPKMLAAGVSVASVEYRFIKEAMDEGLDPPVQAPLADAARALQTVINRYSPYALTSADDPPVYLFYGSAPALGQPQKDATHSANFGVKLKERLDGLGVPCELVFPGAPGVRHPTIAEYLLNVLTTPN